MKLFNAILSTNTVKDAAEILGVHHTKVKGLLEAEGVIHEKGQRYKEAVDDGRHTYISSVSLLISESRRTFDKVWATREMVN